MIYPECAHWFAEPHRPEYGPSAALEAWSRTISFLTSPKRDLSTLD